MFSCIQNESQASASFESGSPRSARVKEYTDSQELEEKSVTELSTKKVHKLNQELLKHNSQLKKSVDTMKKEKFDLLTQNQRLHGEKKTLVKELRRVSSKGEMKNLKASLLDKDEDLGEKVRQLETVLSVKDKKVAALKARLQKFKLETEDTEFWNDSADETHPQVNGCSTADLSTQYLAILEEEKTISSRLREENKELQSRIASLEMELDHIQKEMTDSSPQKKSSSFFKRGKRQTTSMFVRSSEDILNDRDRGGVQRRSRSPESLESSYESQSQSHPKLDFTPTHHSTSSPSLSPRMRRRKSSNPDLKTLQSCLKIAIDEKKTLEENSKRFEDEIQQLKMKVEELEHLLTESQKKKVPAPNSPDTEQLKKKLRMAVSEKTTLSSQCEKLRRELEELKGKNKSLEQNKNLLAAKKDSAINELEEECEKLKRDLKKAKQQLDEAKNVANKVSTPPISNSKPVNESTSAEKKTVSSPKLVKENSTMKVDKPKEVPEATKEIIKQDSKPLIATRKSLVGSSSPNSPLKGSKILAAKAMFEEKDSKVEPGLSSPRQYKRTWSSDGPQRRSSLTTGLPDIKENHIHHAKSNSVDSTLSEKAADSQGSQYNKPKSVAIEQSSKATNSPPATPTPTGSKISKFKVTSSATPTASPVLNVRKEVKEINVPSPRTDKKEQTFTYTTSKVASTTAVVSRTSSSTNSTTPQSPSVSRVGGIVVTSNTTTSTATTTIRTPGTIKKGIESARAQFESKATTPGQAKVMWPSTYYGPKTPLNEPPKKSATQTPAPQPQVTSKLKEEKIVVRRHTTLSVPTMSSPVKKATSMQSIPENITDSTSSSSSGTSTSSTSTIVEAENKITATRSPVAQRIQRRERKDRPKTMYATRSETVSLVKLLSRFQEEEKEKKDKELMKAATTESTRVVNGTASPTTSSTGPKRAPSPVQLRSHASPRQPRPNTYYGGPSNRYGYMYVHVHVPML